MGNSKLEVFLIVLPIFIGSLTLHELAHGLVAYRLGDPTAKLMGRLSLNPIVHLDPLGSLFFVAQLLGGRVPVRLGAARAGRPAEPARRPAARDGAGRDRRADHELPARAPVRRDPRARDLHGHDASEVLVYAFYVNIVLGVFNLLPIPPLDGSRIVAGFMDRQTYAAWSSLDQYGMVILLVLFFVFQGQFTTLLQNATSDVATVISDIVGGTPIIV